MAGYSRRAGPVITRRIAPQPAAWTVRDAMGAEARRRADRVQANFAMHRHGFENDRRDVRLETLSDARYAEFMMLFKSQEEDGWS